MKLLNIKSLLIVLYLLLANASIQAQNVNTDKLFAQFNDSVLRDTSFSDYDRKVIRRYRRWAHLIPTQGIFQTHGNMGVVSLGIGWDYGKREQWETHLLMGFIPKGNSDDPKITMTLKQTFIPWQIKTWKNLVVDPLTCGLYLNTVFGKDFWGSQPDRYPKSYYDFLSTRIRINLFLGQQISWNIPPKHRTNKRSISLFYEFSTCDLYLRSYITEKKVKLTDIVGLSIGAKIKFL
jgi:hypothetical protein